MSIIVGQSARGGGIPVVLFTDETLHPSSPAGTGTPDHGPVAEIIADLEIDPDRLELFGTDGYRVQAELGEHRLGSA